MQSKQVWSRWLLVSVSIIISLLVCEVGSRLVLNPADYLSVRTVKDAILGITIAPKSAGFDEWGFRNTHVSQIADIVAIGDSHTFGNTAAMYDAWPAVIGRAIGRDVYNLGLGGYGPNQYYHLMTTKGLKLRPKWVLCGLYMGDDFENAFVITHGLDYWSSLRSGEWRNVDADIWKRSGESVWGADFRNWLSEHSMVYRLTFHGPLLAAVKETIRFRQASKGEDPYTTVLTVEGKNIHEAFRPIGIAENLEQSSGPVREGMRITFHLLSEMDGLCKHEGCKFVVIIIPTKETVFSDYLENNRQLYLHETLDRVIQNERMAKKRLVGFLDRSGIAYLDTLPALKASVGNHLYAQSTRDMHPAKNGYKVIGEAVAGYLSRSKHGRAHHGREDRAGVRER